MGERAARWRGATSTCRLALAAALVVFTSSALATPASGAPATALPATIRVNVAGLGVSRVLIASASTLTLTAPDGHMLYRGPAPILVRLGVRRGTTTGAEIPPSGDSADPLSLRALLHEARLERATAVAPEIATIPFEVAVLENANDGTEPPLLAARAIVGVRFATDAGFLSFNGRLFRGALEIARDDEGDMIVVNTVATNEYLASVVGSEVPSSWAPEALAAQAIAARTYLLTHLGRHDAYDLEGDTRDQQYDGVLSEAPSTTLAVRRTSGVVATYRGVPISALYSANMGGRTEDSENVFPNALPYLRGVASPGDSVALASDWGRHGYTWNLEYTPKQLRTFMARRGIDVGDVRTIQLLQVTAAGTVVRSRVIGSAGSRDIGKDGSRYYFGLKSGVFTVALHTNDESEDVPRRDDVRLRDMDVLGAELAGTVYTPVPGSDSEPQEFVPSAFRYQLPHRWVFDGRGFGHGVGMSQWGAQGMALAGATHEQILTHYYQGIALTQVGGG